MLLLSYNNAPFITKYYRTHKEVKKKSSSSRGQATTELKYDPDVGNIRQII